MGSNQNPFTQQPLKCDQITLSIAFICITRRRIPVGASGNQGLEQGDVILLSGLEDALDVYVAGPFQSPSI